MDLQYFAAIPIKHNKRYIYLSSAARKSFLEAPKINMVLPINFINIC